MNFKNQITACEWRNLISGLIFGVILAKGGNPIIFSDKIPAPQNFWEIVFSPFPIPWLIVLLLLTAIINIRAFEFKKLKFLPWFSYFIFLWFLWQVVASFFTIESRLTSWTLIHFAACVYCFLFGFVCFKENSKFKEIFWIGPLLAYLWIIYNGLDQRFGGLETIRTNFEQVLSTLPPEQRMMLDTYEFRVKIMSDRIFSVFIYPNAFAGAILLLAPPLVGVALSFRATSKIKLVSSVLTLLIIFGSISCLYWTGSKAGWLVFALMLCILIWQKLQISKPIKIFAGIAAALLIVVSLFVKHADYFKKGSKSLGERFNYWSCALQIAKKNPIFGTGPGTFSAAYREIKKPEYEMAKLAHNDYIEQASDSGFIGFIAYTGFVLGVLIYGYRNTLNNNMLFMTWLGFMGLSLHSLFEFHLYLPSPGWFAFLISGIILGHEREISPTAAKSETDF